MRLKSGPVPAFSPLHSRTLARIRPLPGAYVILCLRDDMCQSDANHFIGESNRRGECLEMRLSRRHMPEIAGFFVGTDQRQCEQVFSYSVSHSRTHEE